MTYAIDERARIPTQEAQALDAEIQAEELKLKRRGEQLPEEKRSAYLLQMETKIRCIYATVALMRSMAQPLSSLRTYANMALHECQVTAREFFGSSQQHTASKQRTFELLDALDLPLSATDQTTQTTIRMKILECPQRILAKETGNIFTVKTVVFDTGISHTQDASDLKNAHRLEICIQEAGSCRPIPLSPEVRKNLLHILQRHHPEQKCCYYFVNEVYQKNRLGIACSPEVGKWHFEPLESEQSLAPGDPICLAKSGVDGDAPQHYALYLSEGLYLSTYGNGGPTVVSSLKEMQEVYPSDRIYRMRDPA